jgi:hypothetical protein
MLFLSCGVSQNVARHPGYFRSHYFDANDRYWRRKADF